MLNTLSGWAFGPTDLRIKIRNPAHIDLQGQRIIASQQLYLGTLDLVLFRWISQAYGVGLSPCATIKMPVTRPTGLELA